jgi:hypothetical protein
MLLAAFFFGRTDNQLVALRTHPGAPNRAGHCARAGFCVVEPEAVFCERHLNNKKPPEGGCLLFLLAAHRFQTADPSGLGCGLNVQAGM